MRRWSLRIIMVCFILFLMFKVSGFCEESSEELFESGKELFREYKYSEAIQMFEKLVYVYPEDELVPDSYFEIGKCYYYKWDVIELKGEKREKEIFDNAINNFKFVVSEYSDSDIADNAQKWLGDCNYFGASVYGKDYYTKAIEEYRKVITNYSKSNLCAVSQFQIGKCYFKLHDYDQAKIELEKVIENYPESIYVTQARFYINKMKEITEK